VFVGRAPGRLDVMGGIADYSGSLVLQLPLAAACHAAVQLQPTAGVQCTATDSRAMLPKGSGGALILQCIAEGDNQRHLRVPGHSAGRLCAADVTYCTPPGCDPATASWVLPGL
jgi:hypothetical protein